jgi:hypothetical protein
MTEGQAVRAPQNGGFMVMRRLTPIGVAFLVLAIPRVANGGETPQIQTSLKRVGTLKAKTLLYATDTHVRVLDPSAAGGPRAVFKTGDHSPNVGPAVRRDGAAVFVTDGKALWQVAPKGKPTKIARLSDMKPANPKVQPGKGSINWLLNVSDSGQHLYFILTGLLAKGDYVCRLDLGTKALDVMEYMFPCSVSIDLRSGVVYSPESPGGKTPYIVRARTFDGKMNRTWPVSRGYDYCQISPNGKRLLLHVRESYKKGWSIATFDIKTGKETLLPAKGFAAAWAGDDAIAYLTGENQLWLYGFSAKKSRQLAKIVGEEHKDSPTTVTVDGKPMPVRCSYAQPPAATKDGSLIAWCWGVVDRKKKTRLGTLLIDVKRAEFRQLDEYWHNVAWKPQKGAADVKEKQDK